MHTPSAGFSILCCTAALSTAIAAAQTVFPAVSSGNNGSAPNGIAATNTQLLFTQGYCAGQQTRGIYQENLSTGTSSLVTLIPDEGVCAENYIAIASGQGGFTAGDTFVTGVSSTNSANSAVYKNGNSAFVDPVPTSKNHVGITFDTSGTFGSNLIVTAEGAVLGYDSSGALQFSYIAPSNFDLEGATVAPLTYAGCPGCLFITAALKTNINNPNPMGNGAIFFVTPGTPSGSTVSSWATTPGPEPEGLVFVGGNLSCSLSDGNGNSFSYFVSGYATGSQKESPNSTSGAILAWTPAQLTPFVGQFLVPDEQGVITAFAGPATTSVFSSTAYQLEGSTILQCASSACQATFGFWKHHPFPSSMFVGGVASIGCMNYSANDLLNILKTPDNGNAVLILAHQLIAAIANYDAGATQTTAATAAIGSSISLLCSNNINMATSVVPPSSPLGQQMTSLASTLDAYNSGAPSCEGTGLITGSN